MMMVPSEEDSVLGKRKELELVESEGKRKKKKKKQDGKSRPACSWVHFSREFIKEYSASHPESSGLKTATKAASEAWKSMSAEEKAKYTSRAREVWKDYLSSAPPRSPKPRKQTNLVTRCSPGRLFNVLQRLTPDQKGAVKSMGFGSLLSLRCRTLRRSLCLWLLERFNTVRRSLEVCGERIPLSPRHVELVMGLAASGKDVVNSGPDDLIFEMRKKYNATNRGISVRLLEERLTVPESGEDFKRSFLLYALGTLLCPTARLDVSPSFLHFLTNMDVVHQFNWGKFLLDRLVREICRFRQGKQRAVGGCLLFLQLFYYEVVAVGGPCDLTPISVPSLSSWGEEEIAEREKQERELGGYGFGEVIYKERCCGITLLGDKALVNCTSTAEVTTGVEHGLARRQEIKPAKEDQVNGDIIVREASPENMKGENIVGGNVELAVVPYVKKNDNEEACACPLQDCNYVGLSKQLSLHFSSKHWDSGRRFRYNCPLSVSLSMNETLLVLQAEEDGLLFLLSRGTESIGHIVMLTRIASSSSGDQFLYGLEVQRGACSLRLKGYTQNFPGQVEVVPQMDFLLIPFGYASTSGQLSLEVCVWNGTEVGIDSDQDGSENESEE